jgi:hypothetical protein
MALPAFIAFTTRQAIDKAVPPWRPSPQSSIHTADLATVNTFTASVAAAGVKISHEPKSGGVKIAIDPKEPKA